MTIREQRERDARIAAEAMPKIVEALREGREALEVSRKISEDYELDLQKAYRWVQYVEERFEAKRSSLARRSAALMWLGIVVALAGVAGLIARYYGVDVPPAAAIPALAVGVPAAVLGAVRGLSVRRRVAVEPGEIAGM
jgi:hypothetical protein